MKKAKKWTRKRKVSALTLSNETREWLDEMAERYGLTRSSMVERLTREAKTLSCEALARRLSVGGMR